MIKQLTFSVVINTYNRAHHLRLVLNSLRFQRYETFEVIVVNGPSTDKTEEVLSEFPDVKSENCPVTNLSMSRNIGIRAASGDVVCFLDDDAITEPFWLQRLAQSYSEGVSGVGGYLLDHTGNTYQCRAVACDYLGRANLFDDFDSQNFRKAIDSGCYPSPTGANATFLRSALLDIGGFDEAYFYYLDETDVCLRMSEAGHRVIFKRGAEVHHKYAESHLRTPRRIPRSLFQPAKSKAYFTLRHGPKKFDDAQIEKCIEHYKNNLFKDNRRLVRARLISLEYAEKLNNEIIAGVLAGKELATKPPKLGEGIKPDLKAPEFKPFHVTLPYSCRLRIAFICREYPPSKFAGISNWTKTLAEGLAQAGHEVHVVTQGSEVAAVDFEEKVWVHRILINGKQSKLKTKEFADLPDDMRFFSQSALAEVKMIHFRRGLSFVSSPIWDVEGAACIEWDKTDRFGIKSILSLHTTASIVRHFKKEWKSSKEGTLKPYFQKIVNAEYAALENSSNIMANSQTIIDQINTELSADQEKNFIQTRKKIDLSKTHIVPHGIHSLAANVSPDAFERFLQNYDDSHCSKGTLRPFDQKFTWGLFAGRLEIRKGADLMLESIPAALSNNDKLAFAFIGEDTISEGLGNLKETFLEKYEGAEWIHRILFLGDLPRDQFATLMNKADFIVCPSRFESFGLIYLEAMSLAKPCIAYGSGSAAEIFRHNDTGVLFEGYSSTELVKAITGLSKNKDLRDKIGQRAVQEFENKYTCSNMIRAAIDYYRNLSVA